MTLFEYLAAGHTLILTFAVVRNLAGFPHVLRAPGRYWVHTTWVFFGLAFCLVAFWAFWSYRDVEWTLVRFMGALEIPAVIYVYNSIVVPSDPAEVDSWRDHYFRVRIPFFATGVLLMSSVIVSNYFVLGTLNDPAMFLNFVFVAILGAGLASAEPRLHVLLALVVTALFVGAVLTILAQPDALVRAGP